MTGTATDLWCLGAVELADVIRSGQASSREVVEPHLRRIEAVNPSANPVVVVLAEQALDAAAAADRALAVGGDLPPLHGVPFTVKENIDVAGTPTTQGLTALVEAYPRRDAPTVERLKAVGGIPVGRTNIGRGARRRWPFACGPTAAARASLGAGSGRPGGIVRPTLSLSRIGGVLVGAHWSALWAWWCWGRCWRRRYCRSWRRLPRRRPTG
jgi:hypothetical protein